MLYACGEFIMYDDDEIIVPDILPAYDDVIFKTLLTHPNAGNVLKSVISSFIGVSVKHVSVRNNELPTSHVNKKNERLDLNCVISTDESGTDNSQIEVEMQSSAMEGDNFSNSHENLMARSQFYLFDLHSSQDSKGYVYNKLKRTFQITICNFSVFPDEENFIVDYQMRTASGKLLNDKATLLFVELKKLEKILNKPIREMSDTEKWAIFFGYVNEPKYSEVIQAITSEKGEIMEAVNILTGISRNEDERARFRARRKAQHDEEHKKAYFRDLAEKKRAEGEAKGIAEGITRGIAEGITRGRAEGISVGETKVRYELARSMLLNNEPIEKIVMYTGFTPEKISSISVY